MESLTSVSPLPLLELFAMQRVCEVLQPSCSASSRGRIRKERQGQKKTGKEEEKSGLDGLVTPPLWLSFFRARCAAICPVPFKNAVKHIVSSYYRPADQKYWNISHLISDLSMDWKCHGNSCSILLTSIFCLQFIWVISGREPVESLPKMVTSEGLLHYWCTTDVDLFSLMV